MAWNVVIAGGGFGGLFAARTLERLLPRHSARITLVNDVNYMLFTPLLPGAAAGTLEPRHVVVPLREKLEWTDLMLARVCGADPQRKELAVRMFDGSERNLKYDQLVVALGSVSRTLPIPGLAEHAVGFKTIAEAIALRNRVLQCLEIAESIEDPRTREQYLTFVVVGAGYAGFEALAELQDFAADVIDRYPRCAVQGMRWISIEATERVMREIPADLAAFAARELRARGIEIMTNTRVERVTDSAVHLSSGDVVPTRTLVWTAGVRPNPAIAHMGLPLDDTGRIRTDKFAAVEGVPDVWAIGDGAAVPDPARKGQASPPTAQHAMRQGRTVAHNVAAALGTGRPRPFTYRTLGVFVDLGHRQAVASTVGIKWRGFPAWFLARTYHMLLMPGLGRRLRLVADWTVGLFFGRDAAELGTLGRPDPLVVDEPQADRNGPVDVDEALAPSTADE